MDAAERALLATTVGDALAAAPERDAAAVDGVLASSVGSTCSPPKPSDAIAVVFDALGRANATTTVLDDVIAHALGIEPRPDLAVLLPSFGTWQVPGRIDDGHVRVPDASRRRVSRRRPSWSWSAAITRSSASRHSPCPRPLRRACEASTRPRSFPSSRSTRAPP